MDGHSITWQTSQEVKYKGQHQSETFLKVRRHLKINTLIYKKQFDSFRKLYMICSIVVIILTLLWGLLLCGAPCGCGLNSRTIPLLLSGIFLCAIAVLPVWILGTAAFLLGGHGENLVCRPLYDQHQYNILGKLLDANGMLYPEGGFFEDFKGNESLKVKNVLRPTRRDFHKVLSRLADKIKSLVSSLVSSRLVSRTRVSPKYRNPFMDNFVPVQNTFLRDSRTRLQKSRSRLETKPIKVSSRPVQISSRVLLENETRPCETLENETLVGITSIRHAYDYPCDFFPYILIRV
ncbi:unnamed protein product [Brassicogethes aeneus]|uniref:Uncharacterized protein n=1 Tax=Brassicogethes aeneus TaxID=1431903 RepID=A0A9P0B0P9_BRAAE|nr:unnamed protein product [Brassicogethes aeneus]